MHKASLDKPHGARRCLAEKTPPSVFAQECLEDELARVLNVSFEHLADELACLLHFWYCKRAVNLLALSPGGHNAGIAQDLDVLREVGLGDTQLALQVGGRIFPVRDDVEQVDTGGVRECLADARLPFIDFLVDTLTVLLLCFPDRDGRGHSHLYSNLLNCPA